MPEETPVDDAATAPEATPPTDDAPLGPEGEKALTIWKERAKKAEADAKRATELEARLAEIEAANMTEHEKALDAARKEAADAARSEITSSVNRRLFAAEVRASVAGKLTDPALLADPDVAVRLLGFDEYPVTDTGDIDAEAISAAVTRLVEERPYLAASATPPPPGPIEQGPRGTPIAKSLDEMIAEAEAAGDFKTSSRLKTNKMLAANGR